MMIPDLQDADETILHVQPHVNTAIRYKERIEHILASHDYDDHKPVIDALCELLGRSLDIIEQEGVFVHDLNIGVLHVLTRFENRDVFLCWDPTVGPRVRRWHEVYEPCACARPIIELREEEGT